jgi:hypothetical protein
MGGEVDEERGSYMRYGMALRCGRSWPDSMGRGFSPPIYVLPCILPPVMAGFHGTRLLSSHLRPPMHTPTTWLLSVGPSLSL